MLLRQPLINRRRQKEPGLAVDRPEVAHRRNILEKRSKRALILSGPSRGVKSDRLLERFQAERARRSNGLLERCELLWLRAMDSAAKPLDTWLIPGDAGPEGYLTIGPKSPDRTLHVEDWAVLTPRAGRALLGFVAGWHSQA